MSAMDDVRTAFVGTIPERYNAMLGPLLTDPVAAITAARVAGHAPTEVLETASGTGILTRRLTAALPGSTRLVASDLNESMLAVARSALTEAANVEFAIADMTELPYEADAFDLVVCQFGLMFVPDRAAAVRDALRVLRPGGHFLVTTWAPLHRNPATQIAHETIGRFFPDDPPRLYETNYGMGDPSEVVGLMQEAGFADTRVETVRVSGRATTARDAAIGLVQGTPVLLEIRMRDEALLPRITTAVEHALAGRFGTTSLDVPLEALIATGTA